MQHLFFLRHGESEYNHARRWAGQTDTPLTSRGQEQAKKSGQTAQAQNFKPDVIISSPLSRAQETALLFAEQIGYPTDKIETDARLTERSFGELEGSHSPLIRLKYLRNEAAIDRYPGVEKLADLQKRAEAYLAHIEERPEPVILLVGHGAFGRALRRAIHQDPLTKRGQVYQNAEFTRFI